MNRGRWLTYAATALCVAAAAALVCVAVGPAKVHSGGWLYALGLVPLLLGWLLTVRAPGSPVGPSLAWLAALMLATPAVEAWGRTGQTAAPWWGAGVMSVIGAGAWPWQLVGFMVLLLIFPSGLLPGRRWIAAVIAVPASVLLVHAAFVLTMNYHEPQPAHSPIAVPRSVWEPVMLGSLLVLLAMVLMCMAAVIVRYRAGNNHVRQQLRWLILAALLVVTLMVASWVATALGWLGPEAYTGFLLGIVVLVPCAVTVAVLRHDLFEIDRLLSDAVAWILTTAVSALALAITATGLGYLLGRESPARLTGSVFLVALAALPVHRVIHRAVARVIDRDRAVILEQLQLFTEQVREGSAEPEQVEAVLRDAVREPGLRLLLVDVGGRGYVDLTGAATVPEPGGVPIHLRTAGANIGLLMVPPGSARSLRRSRLAASAARLPIEVSRLRLGLRRALHEIDDSRRRLVIASTQERHRLERDLHDGAQQQLLAVGMQLRAAQRQLPQGHPVTTELDQAVDRIEHTVAELRRLAHGVRPASLDDGLPAALQRLGADCPLPISFDLELTAADDPGELIATTAYFVVAEAIANILKHARAGHIQVAARHLPQGLQISVTDDGDGGAPTESGLAGLRDRVASTGGTLTVTSPPGSGTTIEAVLPCES